MLPEHRMTKEVLLCNREGENKRVEEEKYEILLLFQYSLKQLVVAIT